MPITMDVPPNPNIRILNKLVSEPISTRALGSALAQGMMFVSFYYVLFRVWQLVCSIYVPKNYQVLFWGVLGTKLVLVSYWWIAFPLNPDEEELRRDGLLRD
ncbi:hypothetical protein DICA4_B12442 [Diutina catenulata]